MQPKEIQMANKTYLVCFYEGNKEKELAIIVNAAGIVIKSGTEMAPLVGQTFTAVQNLCKSKGWELEERI